MDSAHRFSPYRYFFLIEERPLSLEFPYCEPREVFALNGFYFTTDGGGKMELIAILIFRQKYDRIILNMKKKNVHYITFVICIFTRLKYHRRVIFKKLLCLNLVLALTFNYIFF